MSFRWIFNASVFRIYLFGTCFIKPFHIAAAQKIPKALQANKCLTVQFFKFSRPQDIHSSVYWYMFSNTFVVCQFENPPPLLQPLVTIFKDLLQTITCPSRENPIALLWATWTCASKCFVQWVCWHLVWTCTQGYAIVLVTCWWQICVVAGNTVSSGNTVVRNNGFWGHLYIQISINYFYITPASSSSSSPGSQPIQSFSNATYPALRFTGILEPIPAI